MDVKLIKESYQVKCYSKISLYYFAVVGDFPICCFDGSGYSDIRRDDSILQIRGNSRGGR